MLKTLADNGMTRGRFIFMLCYAVFVLLLIFVFIFVGVAAFTGAGTLGAIVNSLLAAGSGEAHAKVLASQPSLLDRSVCGCVPLPDLRQCTCNARLGSWRSLMAASCRYHHSLQALR